MFDTDVIDEADLLDPLLAAVAEADRAVSAVAELAMWQSGDEILLRALAGLTGLVSRVEAQRLRVLREVDQRRCTEDRGGPTAAAWLRSALRVRPSAAGRLVRLAEALSCRYERTREALEAGRVSPDAAQVIVDALDALPVDPEEVRVRAEEFLLEKAAEMDPVALIRLGRHLQAVVDPGADDLRDRGEQDAVARRVLNLSPDPWDGRLHLSGWLDPETGIALRTALDSYAAPAPGEDGRADVRTPAQRNADALAELIAGVLDGGGLPTTGGVRPHVTVTIPWSVMVGGLAFSAGRTSCANCANCAGQAPTRTSASSGPGSPSGAAGIPAGGGSPLPESDWGVPLSGAAARRLACDARIIPVVLGAASEPLDVGRAAYVVPPAMRRALIVRDRGCAFPGCDRPPSWCHAHHVKHWAQGGDTAIGNLVLLCGHHHRLIHRGEWRVGIAGDGLPEFLPPPWIDPAQTPRRTGWRNRMSDLATAGHDPPQANAA